MTASDPPLVCRTELAGAFGLTNPTEKAKMG
jgi:hypothetical protein